MYLYCHLFVLVSVLIDYTYEMDNEIVFCYLPSIANFQEHDLWTSEPAMQVL